MPVVTQEDLNNVHLRSVSSSDLENGQETTADVIEEEISVSPINHQKAKPPVAPKPQRNKWPPNAMVQPRFGTASDPEPVTVKPSGRPEDIYAMINKVKPTVTVPSQSTDQARHLKKQKDCYFLEGHSPQPMRESHQPQNPNVLPFSTTTCSNQYELYKKRRAPPPPLTKTPAVDNSFYNSADQKSPDDSLSPSKLKSPKSPNSASQYHVTLYGVIPSYPMVIEQQHSNAPGKRTVMDWILYFLVCETAIYQCSSYPVLNVNRSANLRCREERPNARPWTSTTGRRGRRCVLYKSKSQTTEDLFTIIHRLISTATKYTLKYKGV